MVRPCASCVRACVSRRRDHAARARTASERVGRQESRACLSAKRRKQSTEQGLTRGSRTQCRSCWLLEAAQLTNIDPGENERQGRGMLSEGAREVYRRVVRAALQCPDQHRANVVVHRVR